MNKWYRPSTWCIGIIKLYQKYISANHPGVCRFSPTCSAYGIEAFHRFGFLGGSVLTLWRVVRCNPLFRGGYDPVPERFHWPWRRRDRSSNT